MSGYIAELRRELVDAAERERRRSAPRRALARTRRPLAAGLAGAATGLAALLGIAALGREGPEPVAAPRVVATVAIGGVPQAAAAGAGAVWVGDAENRVVRIDTDTREVTAVPADGEVISVAASASDVWAAVSEVDSVDDSHDRLLLRIDPQSNEVVSTIGPAQQCGGVLAATTTVVWTQADGQAPGPVARIDPRRERVEPVFRPGSLSALEVHDDALWTLSVTGVVERRDAASGRLLARRRGFAAASWRGAIAPDADGAWIATDGDGMLTRVSADMRILERLQLGVNGPVARAGRWLWVTVGDLYDRNAQLVRVDPETAAVTGRLPLGSRIPSALVAVGDDVWAALSDGTVVVVS
jgi:hypothetical protein